MTAKPIIFTGTNPAKIRAGTKTQTRRISAISDLKLTDHGDGHTSWKVNFHKPFGPEKWVSSYSSTSTDFDGAKRIIGAMYSRYKPGMRLWVREAFFNSPAEYWHELSGTSPAVPEVTVYRADSKDENAPWKSPVCMPRQLSRTLLEVVSVRAERLQDISEADAIAEGFLSGADLLSAREQFSAERERHYPGSWALNPVVEAIEFKVVTV